MKGSMWMRAIVVTYDEDEDEIYLQWSTPDGPGCEIGQLTLSQARILLRDLGEVLASTRTGEQR